MNCEDSFRTRQSSSGGFACVVYSRKERFPISLEGIHPAHVCIVHWLILQDVHHLALGGICDTGFMFKRNPTNGLFNRVFVVSGIIFTWEVRKAEESARQEAGPRARWISLMSSLTRFEWLALLALSCLLPGHPYQNSKKIDCFPPIKHRCVLRQITTLCQSASTSIC